MSSVEYRDKQAVIDCKSKPRSPENHYIVEKCSDYDLGFVEFDDQGVLWRRGDASYVLNQIRTIVNRTETGALMLTYVHGWKHNAIGDDSDVVMLRETLFQLSKMENLIAQSENRVPRRIVGTYIGWRGYSITNSLGLSNLSPFSRKRSAEIIGRRDAAEVFGALESIWTARRAFENGLVEKGQRAKTEAPTRLFTIGHSFGADLLFNAVSQTLLQRLASTGYGLLAPERGTAASAPSPLRAYGDLTVLINPAFESLQINAIRDIVISTGKFDRDQRPVLVALTSETDHATGFIFHASRLYRNVNQTYRVRRGDPIDLDERSADQISLGHNPSFLTHSLEIEDQAMDAAGEQDSFKQWIHGGGELRIAQLGAPESQSNYLRFIDKQVVHVDRLPILNVEVSSKILDGHSIPSLEHDLPRYNLLVGTIAGLIRLADYPTDESQWSKRDDATLHMRKSLSLTNSTR